MNRAIYTVAYKGKKFLNKVKFCYKSLEAKLKANTAEMTTKTEMLYEDAVHILNNLHLQKEIDFTRRCVRSKDIKYDVSIIVPVYNAEKNLETCIKSLINQKTKYSYEIICVNDGSNDNSLRILNGLAEYDDRIIVVNQANGGASIARNAGIRIAEGKYFFFVDADDIVPEDSINLLLETALKTKADIVQGNIGKCNGEGKIYYVGTYKRGILNTTLDYYNCNMSGTTWGRLYRRELWDKIDFFPGYAYEDAIIWCNVYSQCKIMVYEPELIYIFRSQDNSLFKRQNNSEKCLDSIWVIDECVKLHEYLSNEESDGWYQMILWQLSVGIVTRIGYISNDEVLQASFVIAKHIAESLRGFGKTRFEGQNKRIYREIEDSFRTTRYKKWVAYSWLLSYSEKI